MNYSVIGYNPYMNCGSYYLNNRVADYNVAFSSQPDTVSLSSNNQTQSTKTGLSKNAKLGLGALALVGIGAAAYILSRGKIGNKPAQQLAEHIEFQPAKTIEEARAFAKDRLGVHYSDIDDLEVVNFFNEWITGLHNKCKIIDKSSYPKFIANYSRLGEGELACLCDSTLKVGREEGYVMGVNMPLIKNFGSSMDKWICDGSVIAKNKTGNYVITNKSYDTEFTRNLVKRMNEYNPKTTFKEKNRIILDIMGLQDGKIVNGKIQEIHYHDFHCLNHELGHLRHQEAVNNYNLMKKVDEFNALSQPVSDITHEFVTNPQIQQTARKVSDYATESPLEFVAETFSQLMEGKTFSDDVMALYKKYGGPVLS